MLDIARRVAQSHRTPLSILIAIICIFLISRSNLNRLDNAYDAADNMSYDLPMQQYFNQRLAKGELPLWNPYQSAGNPMIGTLEARLIYPPRLLLTMGLGLDYGQLMEIIFHFSLTVIGTFAMLRSFRLTRIGSLIGALSVMLSTEFLASFAAFNVNATQAWVPVCIWAIRRFIYHPDLVRSGLLGFSFSMLIYAGYPQFAYYAVHACVIVFLFTAYHLRRRILKIPGRFFLLLIAAVTLFGIISAAQLVTASELFSRGLRSEVGVSIHQFNPFGSRSYFSLLPQLYAGGKLPPPVNGRIEELIYPAHSYVFLAVIVCSMISGFLFLPKHRPRIVMVAVVAFPFVLLSVGGDFANLMFKYYPLGSAFRVPQRSLFLLLFPCAFFIGLTHITLGKVIANHKVRIGSQGALLLLLGLLLIPGKALRTQAFINVSKHVNHYAENIRKAIPGGSDDHYDTICFFGLEPCQKAGMIAERRNLSDYEPANTYRSYLFSRLMSAELRNLPQGYLWLGETNINIDTFTDRSALKLLQISSVKWIMANSELWRRTSAERRAKIQATGLVSPVTTIPDDTAKARLLEQMSEEKLKMLTDLLPKDTSLYTIFKLDGTISRAYLTNRIVQSRDANESAKMLTPPFDPMNQTVLEIPTKMLLDPGKINPRDHLKRATFAQDEPEKILIHTESDGEAFLVLNDKYFPGWECRIDGQETTIFPANVMFRAVKVPPGKHEVEFLYRPRNFYISFCVSLVGYAILIVFLVIGFRKLRARKGTQE